MRHFLSFPLRFRVRMGAASRAFSSDTRGATAVEFALVAVPFFALMLSIMTIGMQYMTLHFLEHGVADASRKLRTGEAQKAGLTLNDFRKMVCDSAGSMIACDNHLVVHIKSSATFAGLSPATNCVTDGNLTPAGGGGADGIRTRAGNASTAVMVSACYNWELGSSLWSMLWALVSPMPRTEGKNILSVTTAFRSEPFE